MNEIIKILTPLTYWVLIVLWTIIFSFYIKKIRNSKNKHLLYTLMLILAIDAFRTLFESLYFGIWYTSLSGFIPEYISQFLIRPEMVIIPKLVNVIVAVVVILILIKKWLPQEEIERERVRGALQESEIQLLKAQKIAQLGHYILNVKTGDWKNSKELDSIFGIDENYKRNIDGWLNIAHPEFRQMMSNYLKEDIFCQHLHFDKEYKINNIKTGEEKWVHGLGFLKFDDDNIPIEMFGTIQDITSRIHNEELMRRYECIVSSSSDMLAFLNKEFVYLVVNEKYANAFGKNPEEFIGMTPIEIFGVEYFNSVIRPNAKKCLNGQVVSFQNEIEFPTYGKKFMEVSFSPYFNQENVVIGFVVNARDITKRKQAEESNTKLSRAIEQADETIVITDVYGNIEYVNPAFEKTSGFLAKESIGKNQSILKSGKQDKAFYENLWNTISSGKKWHGEIVNKNKDGSLYIENTVISPVLNSQGEIVNYVAAKNDITETKRLQQLESRASRLEMAGTIAGQVAHDFNNLLAPLMVYPEFLREKIQDEKLLVYIDTIEESAKKIAEINQDLLTMGRRGHYNQSILNINKIVQKTVIEMEARTDTVTCKFDFDENIMNIKGGEAQIHRIFTNLLVNAQDAMENSGTITIKTENYYADDTTIIYGHVPKGEYVKVTITDQGCGIPDEIVQNILDPFFSTKVANKKRGCGLGMSVVDAVLKDHNGFLDLTSIVGKGTSFYIYLPITRDNLIEKSVSETNGGTENLLIVDDDDIIREVLTNILTKLGYSVSAVESGEEAMLFLKNNPQDLIVLDMVMPFGIDGCETFRQILEIYPFQKALIVSGFSDSSRVIEARKLGVGAFVKKPFTQSEIAVAVRNELDCNKENITIPS